MKYYTVDRSGSLFPGKEIKLINDPATLPKDMPENLKNLIQELFPEGTSRFGDRYLIRDIRLMSYMHSGDSEMPGFFFSDELQMESNIELIWELIRRVSFSDKPSRFQSMFCFETYEEAVRFRTKHGNFNSKIFSIESDHLGFKADTQNLRITAPLLSIIQFANAYWSGKAFPYLKENEQPLWESVMPLPVQVGEIVG